MTPAVVTLNKALSVPEIEKVIASPSESDADIVKAPVWFSWTEINIEVLVKIGASFELLEPPEVSPPPLQLARMNVETNV